MKPEVVFAGLFLLVVAAVVLLVVKIWTSGDKKEEKEDRVRGGFFKAALWYIASFLYCFSPLMVLGFPFLINLVLTSLMMFLPIVGELIRIVLYVVAIIVELGHPIDTISIVFFIFAALYFFTTLVPLICSLLSRRK